MYQRILVPIDGSDTSNRGLKEAIDLARLTEGRLRLMHLVDALPCNYLMDAYSGDVGAWMDILKEDGKKLLQVAQTQALAAGVPTETVLHEGMQRRLYEFVEDEAKGWQADLVVLGTHGRRGVNRLLLGSDAERIVRTATVPVLLVRLPEPPATAPVASTLETVHVRLPSAALSIE